MTFLFTDLEGSTRLWEQFPDAMSGALERHDSILRAAIEERRGHVVKATGDGMMAVFGSATDAATASLAAQRELGRQAWQDTSPLRVRIGIHAGQADERAGDYFGPTVNRTARIMAAGHGGQVLLSAAAAALARDELPEGATLLDLGEHRLKDLDRPEHVYQLRHADLAQSFPPLATVRQATADLPARVDQIIGRADELAQIKTMLADPQVRLLTLTGPGGAGKTTLAVRVAEELEGGYASGAAFVDLSSARDTTAVLAAIARAVGLTDAVERPLLEELTSHLHERTMLLVLDNLEQVTEAAAAIAQLLRDCPGLTLLTTSREALHVRAERVLQVPPLAVPPANAAGSPVAATARFEAVQLFIDRARVVRSDFELTEANAPAVAEICRRLDGLPLAIELAAARLRLFSPEVLLERLSDRLALLRSGPRDLPERQQALRATMDWSHELLDPGERVLFEIMGAFADADLDAIESVVADVGPVDGLMLDVVDGLASLVEKSLVRQLDAPGETPRFAMLETIREFARDRLAQRPNVEALARAGHARYFSGLADRCRVELGGHRRQAALAALAADSANLRLCWSYWVAAGDLEQLNRLVGPLMAVDDDRGWYLNTIALTRDMLTVLEQAEPSTERVGQEIALRTSLARALMATRGVTPEVEEAFTSALELFERGGDTRQQFSVLRGLASLYQFRAQVDRVAVLGQQILDLGERERDPQILIDGNLMVGAYLITAADPGKGLEHLDRAIALFEGGDTNTGRTVRIGNDSRVACYTTAALALQFMGLPERASARADAALDLAARLGHPYTSAYARFHAALQRLFQRDAQAAYGLTASLLEVAEEHGFRIWIAAGRFLRGAAAVGLGRFEEGLADIRAGMGQYQELNSPPVFWPFLLYLDAAASHAAGRSADAVPRLEAAIEMLSSPPPGAMLLPELHLLKGDVLLALAPDGGATAEAESLYQRAFARASELEARTMMLRAATRLARLSATPTNARADARERLRRTYDEFTEGFATADLVEARDALARLDAPD